jgi:hypothetical protein
VRSEEIVITPDFERLAGGLQARSRENVILLNRARRIPETRALPDHDRGPERVAGLDAAGEVAGPPLRDY